jgi:glycosyltransferase involved in cell wall biosynthesis
MAEIIHFIPLAAVGGCEIGCLRIIESLPQFAHRVLVFDQIGPMDDRWHKAGAAVEHLNCWHQNPLIFGKRLGEWVRRQNAAPFGVIYWSNSRLPFVLNAIEPWHRRCVVHLGNPLGVGCGMKLRLQAWELLGSRASRAALVACSDYVRDSHARAPFFARYPTATIYNPVSQSFLHSRDYCELSRFAPVRFGMVARLDAIKDQATLLRAFPSVLAEWPAATLEFAGAGERESQLKELAQSLALRERVRFLGSVTDVPTLLRQWDIYLHSTTPQEGMGNAVAEAMMSGLPCILSDIRVMREVGGEEAARYAQAGGTEAWAKEIKRLLADSSARRTIGTAAQERAKRLFDASAVAERYLHLLQTP